MFAIIYLDHVIMHYTQFCTHNIYLLDPNVLFYDMFLGFKTSKKVNYLPFPLFPLFILFVKNPFIL